MYNTQWPRLDDVEVSYALHDKMWKDGSPVAWDLRRGWYVAWGEMLGWHKERERLRNLNEMLSEGGNLHCTSNYGLASFMVWLVVVTIATLHSHSWLKYLTNRIMSTISVISSQVSCSKFPTCLKRVNRLACFECT